MICFAQRLAVLDGDAADAEDEIDLGLGETIDGLIGGDAILVEPARFLARFEDGHVVAMHGEAMSAGEARRPRPDDGHSFPVAAARWKGCRPDRISVSVA